MSRVRIPSPAPLLALLAAALIVPASVAAKDGDVIRRGSCSAGSTWKLKLSPEDGRIEVEVEVDSNRSGHLWSVRPRQNGVRFFKADRTTKPPSRSFEVERLRPNAQGPDSFVGRAINYRHGEVCRGSATF